MDVMDDLDVAMDVATSLRLRTSIAAVAAGAARFAGDTAAGGVT
jgi:hypothetical protein